MKFSVKNITTIGLFAALTAVLSQISIPIGEVPITLQTFAVMLSAFILNKRDAVFSQLVYLLLGAVGVPVFANFKGGFHVITGVTGGFLIAFPIMALLIGILLEKTKTRNIITLTLYGILALIICYTLGVIQFTLTTGTTIKYALTVCVVPFVIFDIIKTILAAFIGNDIRKKLVKANLL